MRRTAPWRAARIHPAALLNFLFLCFLGVFNPPPRARRARSCLTGRLGALKGLLGGFLLSGCYLPLGLLLFSVLMCFYAVLRLLLLSSFFVPLNLILILKS